MKTAVIAAMKPELDELVSRLEGRSTVERAGFAFHEGRIAGHSTVLVLSGVGKVNAAVGTALMIEDYRPDAVINTGVAGGFDPNLRPGDIVLSTETRHHDADVRPFGYEMGQVPGMPASYPADSRLLELARDIHPGDGSVRVQEGLVVSGDLFIHDPAEVERIREHFPEVLAGEMEAAAVAQTCYLFGIPYLVARSVSDVVGGGENAMEYEEFLPLAAARSVDFVTKMLDAMEEQR